jgi:8-oxo-dGTP diphosphatase
VADEKRFVSPTGFPAPGLAVDGVLVKGREVLLIRRGRPPFEGAWAIPGGFVEVGESCEDAVRREVAEETGLLSRLAALVGVYSDPKRDPRGHVVSVVYLLAVSGVLPVKAGDDAAEARWFPLDALPPLAFDHDRILADARRILDEEPLILHEEACG